jgi:hypothetical protein
MPNEPSEESPPTWDEQAVERMKKLKDAQNRGRFAEAFREMFPPDDDEPSTPES